MNETWRPSANIETLRRRADFIASIRRFFAQRQVLEVETPALSHHTVTDLHLQTLYCTHTDPNSTQTAQLYLQSSPEYAMKRLLCAGSGSIFQICKSFRDDEVGRLHNPEFTMLEWYRVDFDMPMLIAEVCDLLHSLLALSDIRTVSYQALFERYLGIDPLTISLNDLIHCCNQKGYVDVTNTINVAQASSVDHDMLLQLLFNQEIEAVFCQDFPCIVTHFPASQAALAKLDDDDPRTAKRFELYYKGIELANGYEELQDPSIQQARMEQDNALRVAYGKPQQEIDHNLLDALRAGLPPCAGVALGLDRLFMLASGATHIKDVLSFHHANA